jgi:hypothetical protein
MELEMAEMHLDDNNGRESYGRGDATEQKSQKPEASLVCHVRSPLSSEFRADVAFAA